MAKSWEQQEGEPEAAYSRFLAFLTLGVGRSIIRAYRLTHPDSEASAVSGVWREESSKWAWRKRANDHDLSTFRESARETVAAYGEGMRAIARKALEALESELPELKPRSWNEALDAFAVIRSLIPMETISALVDHAEQQGDPKGDPKSAAEGELVEDKPESFYLEQEYLARTGHYPREVWVDPPLPTPSPPAG